MSVQPPKQRGLFGAPRPRVDPKVPPLPPRPVQEFTQGDVVEALRRVDNAIHGVEEDATAMAEEQPTDVEAGMEKLVAEQQQVAPAKNLPDPAPPASAIATERAHQLVSNISSTTIDELRKLRDQIDELMRDIHQRRDLITDAIKAHAQFAESTVNAKTVIADGLATLRDQFEKSNTQLPR